jgi:flagellar motor switch protein FliN/FliY
MNEMQQKILETLGEQFSVALEGMLGEHWPATVAETPLPQGSDPYFCWSQKLNIHKDPVLLVAVSSETWRAVGTRALSAVGLEDADDGDVRATYLELLTQAMSGLARFLTGCAGSEVALESGSEVSMPAVRSGDDSFLCIQLNGGDTSAELFVRVDPALLRAIEPRPESAPQPAAAPAEASQPQAAAAAAASAGPASAIASSAVAPGSPPPASLDLLLDVEMPVSVSFGRTQLQLKEAIKLSTGSIIELNRTINEPVEVIVNNCVIARGEVVVIEGNYGVRIQQIVSRTERLRTLD